MNWGVFAIILYICTALQTAVAPFVGIHGVVPNLMVLFAIYLALTAPAMDALICAWIIGLLVDLNSMHFERTTNIGVNAFAFGMVAMAIIRLRNLTFRDQMMAFFVFTFAGSAAIRMWTSLYVLFQTGQLGRWDDAITITFATALYTSMLAPYAHVLFSGLRDWLGIAPPRVSRIR